MSEVNTFDVEVRRNTATLRSSDIWAIIGALTAALSLTWLIFTELAPFTGVVGFVVIAWVLFIAFYGVLVFFDEQGPAVRDRVASVIVHGLAGTVLLALGFVVVYTFYNGWRALAHVNFFTKDMSSASSEQGLDQGGMLHAVAGTLIQAGIALAITVPLGLLCAVFLNEIPGRFSRFVRTIVEAMTALPSIVAGLFIYATLIIGLGLPKSGLAAALAIGLMMLPIIIRAADVVLRLVPGTLKEASYALGSGQWRTVWHVVLPTARSGLTTAIILGTARGVGETSPVLLTAGFASSLNLNPFDQPMTSLPLATFNYIKFPQELMHARAFGAAALLMLVVLVLFVIARMLGGKAPGQLTRRQEHRRVLRSWRDAERFAARTQAAPSAIEPVAEAPQIPHKEHV